MLKTLYITDLDGTLLKSDETISAFSIEIINNLVSKGMLFSYATARSLITAEKVTAGLNSEVLSIVYNGAFIINNKTKALLLSNFFPKADFEYVQNIILKNEIYPIVYAYINGIEKFSFHTKHINKGMQLFLNRRKNDIRKRPVQDNESLFAGEAFYFTCIDEEELLLKVFNILKEDVRFNCIYQKDIYSKEQWLEILPAKATKANAILQLKKIYGCNRIISFGDGRNDISMFNISDECYAVKNANPELKSIATGIIPSNNEDGVVKWLLKNVQL